MYVNYGLFPGFLMYGTDEFVSVWLKIGRIWLGLYGMGYKLHDEEHCVGLFLWVLWSAKRIFAIEVD